MRKMDRGLSVTAAFLVLGLAFLADARPTAPVNAVGPDTQSSDLSAYIQELDSEQSDHQNDDFSGENQIDFNQLDEDFSAEFNQSKHHSPAKLDQLKESPAELGQLKGALPAEQLEDDALIYDSEKELELEQSHSRQSSPIDSLVHQMARLYKSALSLQAAQAGGRRNEPLSGPYSEDVITEDVFTEDDLTTDELMHHGDDLPTNTKAGGRKEPLSGLHSDASKQEMDHIATPASQPMRPDGDNLDDDNSVDDTSLNAFEQGIDHIASPASRPIRPDGDNLDNAISTNGE